MTVFETFQEASEAARKMASDMQQNVYVFRVLDGSWNIWAEAVDIQDIEAASPETGDGSSMPPGTETVSGDWGDPPF